MRLKCCWALAAGAVLVVVFASAFAGDGAVSDINRVWQVRYHSTHPQKTGDIALRLKIDAGSGKKITGTLKRYDKVDMKTKKYVPRDPAKGGVITFNDGKITKDGNGKKRMREEFYLTDGHYTDASGTHNVTIRGFHHGGQDLNSRTDDYICIRINDKPAALLKSGAVPVLVDCDDEPPDEDNLSDEDPTTDPPDYDPPC